MCARQYGRIGTIAAAFLIAACASLRVNSYMRSGIDFHQYHVYRWASAEQFDTGDPRLDNNRIFLDRLRSSIDRRLAARGLEASTSERQDLVLHVHMRIKQQLDLTTTDARFGPCVGCGPTVFEAGTLVIDFVDARSGILVWRGWSEGSLDGVIDNQQWLESRLDDAVSRITSRLPW